MDLTSATAPAGSWRSDALLVLAALLGHFAVAAAVAEANFHRLHRWDVAHLTWPELFALLGGWSFCAGLSLWRATAALRKARACGRKGLGVSVLLFSIVHLVCVLPATVVAWLWFAAFPR